MKKLIALLLLCSTVSSAQTFSDITYVERDTGPLVGDLYMPTEWSAHRSAVILVHGGGFAAGDKTVEFAALSQWFADHGYVAFTINYRLNEAGRYPNSVFDVVCAVKYLKANASEYGINPHRIALVGGSAGGYLVAAAGLIGYDKSVVSDCGQNDAQNARVRAVIAAYGPYDFQSDLAELGSFVADRLGQTAVLSNYAGVLDTDSDELRAQKFTATSILNHIHKRIRSRWLLMHGDADGLVPVEQSVALYGALSEVRIRTSLILLPGINHGFLELASYADGYAAGLVALEPWLNENFKTR